jgi:SAM-dependent methyltransferase
VIRRSLVPFAALAALALVPPAAAQEAVRVPDVVYVPTPEAVVEEMMDLAKVGPGDVVYDLGCGDGRLVIAAAKRGARKAVGVDIDPERIREARENARSAGVEEKVTFIEGDLFEQDFSDATVVTLYLLPELNLRLRPKILALRPGTRIVSHSFDMGDWKPDATVHVMGKTVYAWTVPAGKGRARTSR